jgi:hypothetical protein
MNSHYDTTEKLGLLQKGQVIVGLGKLVDLMKLKPKK